MREFANSMATHEIDNVPKCLGMRRMNLTYQSEGVSEVFDPAQSCHRGGHRKASQERPGRHQMPRRGEWAASRRIRPTGEFLERTR